MPSTVCNPIIQGTLYLKQAYQKNMFVAMLVAVSAHMAALGVLIALTDASLMVGSKRARPLSDVVVLDFLPPPPPIEDVSLLKSRKSVASPDIRDADAVAEGHAVLPSKLDKLAAAQTGSVWDAADVLQKYPEAIHLDSAKYPPAARAAGIQGWVVIRVLIDTDGAVIDAEVVQSSIAALGFEEAAIEAALRSKWIPAAQDFRPVQCWLSYKVAFELY